MNWQKIFTDYWGQITLLLLAISYFVKRVFDNKSKKIEINHSLFQQNRITAINTFFKNYAKAELMWNQLQIWNIVSNKLSAIEMDKIIIPPLNEVRQSVLELKIYFEPAAHKSFEQILDNFLSINGKLMDIYFWSSNEETITRKVNDFDLYRTKMFKENNRLIDLVCSEIKETFK